MTRLMHSDHLKVALAAVVWGSSGAFVKYLELPAGVIALFRVGIPVVVLGIWFGIRGERIFGNGIRLVLMASLVNAVRLLFYFIGYLNAPIGNAIIILYTWPVFAVVFSHFFLKEPLPLRNKMLLLLAMAGIVMVFMDKPFGLGNEVFVGMLAMLVSAGLNATSVVMFKHQITRFNAPQIVFFQNFIGVLFFLPFFIGGMDQLTLHKTSVASLYALLVGLIGYGVFFQALRRVRASTASFLAYIEVISGIAFGVLLFNEVFSWNELVGGAMILMASVLLKK